MIDSIDEISDIVQIESNGKTMPLIALYKRKIKDKFNTLLQKDERRLRIAIKACQSKNIILEKEFEFSTMNVNTQTDLKAVEDAYKH